MSNIDPSIFKAYDIRGIYPEQLNEELVYKIVQAICKLFLPKTAVIGRDMRLSSPSLNKKAIEALVDAGVEVVDVGLVSTPTFYFASFKYKYDLGILITASHNPKEYNGVKIVKRSEEGLVKVGKPTGMEDIKRLVLEGSEPIKVGGGSVTQRENVLEEEVESAFSVLGNPNVNKFKIVADPANAMGSLYIDALFKKVPADLIRMNFELDGTFPVHQPDPLQFETLVDLQKRVVEEKADVGLAPDGDGDRLFFIDEKGKVIPGSLITALVAKDLLQKYPGEKILFDIRYTITPREIVKETGGESIITRVGHAFITQELSLNKGIFAGESSGHYYYRATGGAESQVITLLSVLSIMSKEKKPLSKIIEGLRRSYESGEINFKTERAKEVIAGVEEKYPDGEISTLDGISVEYPSWRFNIRTSNTEPLLRLNVEARSKELVESKTKELVALIKENSF